MGLVLILIWLLALVVSMPVVVALALPMTFYVPDYLHLRFVP